MPELNRLAHFLYGEGFWYVDPEREIKGLSDDQLLWIPQPKGLPILWNVGHIAHRERFHIGVFLQGLKSDIIPMKFKVFGTAWHSVEDIKKSIGSVQEVLDWVREVRQTSQEYISSLSKDDFNRVPQTAPEGLSVAHWLFITTAHTALHIGRIQLLRAMIEEERERAY